MCQHCNATNTTTTAAPIARIQHARNTLEQIGKPLLGFHRASKTGVFTLTYGFEVIEKGTETVLQHLRFDITILPDGTFSLLIADKDANVLHEQTFASAVDARDFMDSLIFVDKMPTKDGFTPVETVNLALKNGYLDNEDSLISYLLEQDKTPLTVYLGFGGLVVDRHKEALTN